MSEYGSPVYLKSNANKQNRSRTIYFIIIVLLFCNMCAELKQKIK
jgi:hypothetical protein